MAGCCNSRGCDWFFSDRFARRVAKRYRKRGLDKPSRQIVEFLQSRGVKGASVLEIGGGIGEIQLELLKRGAARTINLELSPAYDDLAAQLAREIGVEDRIERRLHDIAVDPAGVEPVDIVVLNRVVCCYPDYERLLTAAADHAGRLLVFSHPPGSRLWRSIAGAQNLGFRLLRKEFRSFAHPPDAMLAVLERQGLRHTFTHRGLPFSVAGLEREHAADRKADVDAVSSTRTRETADEDVSHEHAAKRTTFAISACSTPPCTALRRPTP